MKQKYLSKTWIVCLIAMFCCFLWGSAFPSIKIGYKLFAIESQDYSTQMLFAGLRFSLAGTMTIFANSVINGRFIKPSSPSKIFVLSIFQTSLQYTFFYIGLARTTGVKSSIITGAGVFLTILVSSFVFKQEKLNRRKIIGTAIGFIGIILVNVVGKDFDLAFKLAGEGFIFISALASAFSSAFIKKFSKDSDVVMLSGYQFFTGGIMLATIGFMLGGRISIITMPGIAMLTYLGFISAAAYTLWSVLLKYNPVSKVTVFKFMNPLFGAVLSAMFIDKESGNITWVTEVTLMLVCVGIFLVNTKKREKS